MKIKHPTGFIRSFSEAVQIGEVKYVPPLIGRSSLTGFDFSFVSGGLLHEAERVFEIARNEDVRQLSFLFCPLFGMPRGNVSLYTGKDHKRAPHMRGVAAMGNIFLYNNRRALMSELPLMGFTQDRQGWNSFRNTVLTGLLTHDRLSVAGGDGIKLISPKEMDEDALYHTALDGKDWEFYRNERSINVSVLLAMIQNEGLPGRVLDIFDKADYVARDCMEYLRLACGYVPGGSFPHDDQIASVAFEDQNLCALWQSAEVIGGQVVITDHRRLARFLRLRALMFNQVYNNRDSRVGEVIICQCLAGSMYRQGILTAEQLMRSTDTQLEGQIGEYLGSPGFMDLAVKELPEVQEFDSLENALDRFNGMDRDVDTVARVEQFEPRTSCGTEKFMTMKDGKIGSFAELFPDDTVVIRDLIAKHRPFRLSSGKLSSFGVPSELRPRIKSAMSLVPLVL